MSDDGAEPFQQISRRYRNQNFRVLSPDDDAVRSAAQRTPPASAEAEEHVLACCLLDGSTTIARCLREKITPESFYLPANKLIFEVIAELHAKNHVVNLEMLAEELKTRRQLEVVGGFAYLMQVTSKIPTTSHAGYFIQTVREKWVLRRLVTLGTDLVEKTYDFTGGLEDFVSRHALRLQRLAGFVTRQGKPSQQEDAQLARTAAHEILAGKVDHSHRLSFGLPWADKNFLPIDVKNEDWFTIIGAGPSGGKSSVMRFAAGANCRKKKRGAVFLLETGKRRWLWSLAAGLAKVNFRDMLDDPKRAFPKDVASWIAADDEVTAWVGERLFVYDDLFFIEDIERQIREVDRTLRDADLAAGVPAEEVRGLDFVVIDYLQLMTTREKIRVRQEIVSHLARRCKMIFKTMDIAGLVAAQINRNARDEGRRPKLSDLRESGAIEQDSDRVIFVHTPTEDKAGVAQTGERSIDEVELIQAKSRNGPKEIVVDVLFHKKQARYEDAVRPGDARPGMPKPEGGYRREEQ